MADDPEPTVVPDTSKSATSKARTKAAAAAAPTSSDASPSPSDASPTPDQSAENPEDDPHFVPHDDPNFIPVPDEPTMDASGPTDRDAPDFGEPTEEDEDGDTSDQTDESNA